MSLIIRGGARASANFRLKNQLTAASKVLPANNRMHMNQRNALTDSPYTRTTTNKKGNHIMGNSTAWTMFLKNIILMCKTNFKFI